MKNKRALWVMTTALSLSAFSFAAGFGIKSLAAMARSGRFASATPAYTRVASAAPGAADPDLRPAELYKDVYNKLHLFYVEPLPAESKLAQSSIEEMLAELKDPNTRLLTRSEWQALQQLTQGRLSGLGAILTVRTYNDDGSVNLPPVTGTLGPARQKPEQMLERNVTVVAPLPGSAAEKAGLQPGDRITHLDGRWIAPEHLSFRLRAQIEDDLGPQDGRPLRTDEDAPQRDAEQEKEREKRRELQRRWLNSTELDEALEAFNSGKPGEHELTIQRPGVEKPLKVKVTFADGQTSLFSARTLNPTTGYLRIAMIRPETPGDVEKALAEFQRTGVQKLVVDLRNCPGGPIDAVRETVALLAPGAPVMISRERDGNRKLVDRKITAKAGTAKFRPAAVSILVDRGTAGAGEVLAAALRDALGAKLVGTQTFGDGTEQHVVPLPNGAAFTVTHALMLTPKGVSFEGKGLKPDRPAGPGEQGIEAALKALDAPGGQRASGTARREGGR